MADVLNSTVYKQQVAGSLKAAAQDAQGMARVAVVDLGGLTKADGTAKTAASGDTVNAVVLPVGAKIIGSLCRLIGSFTQSQATPDVMLGDTAIISTATPSAAATNIAGDDVVAETGFDNRTVSLNVGSGGVPSGTKLIVVYTL